MQGNIYLLPVTLGDTPIENVLPEKNRQQMNQINYYVVENVRSARRFLSSAGIERPIRELIFFELNKHTPEGKIPEFIKPVFEGEHLGIISEAGCPGIADPGTEIVKLAHENNIKVIPLSGPSSILMALMASGLNGQSFAFNGYLPIDSAKRNKEIKKLENRSKSEKQSQIFMETPYRNNQLLKNLVQVCQPCTYLCIAADISLKTEYIKTQQISEWKQEIPDLHKRPAIFILL